MEEDLEPYVRRRTERSEENRRTVAMTDEEEKALRSCINSRERRRMHDLNDAMEDLRSVLPYFKDANNRRMSKISTLILAANWIRHLNKANATLTAQVEQLTRGQSSENGEPPVPSVKTDVESF